MPDFLPEMIDIRNGPLAKLLIGCKLLTVIILYSRFEFMSPCGSRIIVHPEKLWGRSIHYL